MDKWYEIKYFNFKLYVYKYLTKAFIYQLFDVSIISVHLSTKTFLNISNQSHVTNKIIYLPNFYPRDYWYYSPLDKEKEFIDIACFGAIRPLKNHMVQAIAAIKYANKFNKKIRFHINSERIEMGGNPVLNNLQGLFQHLADSNHQLIQHKWTCRDQFLDLCMKMDVGLQCNFSETFNIVSADIISQGVPIVSSKEIPENSEILFAILSSIFSISSLASLSVSAVALSTKGTKGL